MKKGYRYSVTLEQIREYQKLTPKQKLQWLEEANRFSWKVMSLKAKKIRQAFRAGLL